MFKVKNVLLCLGLGLSLCFAPTVKPPAVAVVPPVNKYLVSWVNSNAKGKVCRTEIYYGDGNFATNSFSTNAVIFSVAGKNVKAVFFATNGEIATGTNCVRLQ